ncbi:MAG TPA: hypothetical protein VNO86_10135 [Candidatus Binatia bacterium]|nr:hypothetical protein [Candidatus Binatia bacterium]
MTRRRTAGLGGSPLGSPLGSLLGSLPGRRFEARGRSRRLLRGLLPGTAAGLVIGFLLSLAWVVGTGGVESRDPEIVLVAIPAGTAERIARGETTSPIPANVSLRPGDTLVVRNDDVVGHAFGGYAIAPGTILSLPVGSADRGRFVCSFHPSGTLALDVVEPPSPGGIVLTGLLVGLPLGLLLGGLSILVGALEPGPGGNRRGVLGVLG